jgi:hypothetical protein
MVLSEVEAQAHHNSVIRHSSSVIRHRFLSVQSVPSVGKKIFAFIRHSSLIIRHCFFKIPLAFFPFSLILIADNFYKKVVFGQPITLFEKGAKK